MSRNNYAGYYRVSKNDTVITEISANDFMPVLSKRFRKGLPVMPAVPFPALNIPWYPTGRCFYGYLDKATAMERY